ncbi:hypothetical protein [Actinomycetospora termitidis]|uniref:Translation initiation factor IF-2 n=1 Tax=Actinomycetospora termitidis TaxID=3053470 RepID=A0ABT7M3R4_9PSEU|nr:hypothetical protein [Actinomycetospora sp. Odt1-22]MDL5155066.1 hypothetical protein [Actinomycetospora sp. Odt1-22]
MDDERLLSEALRAHAAGGVSTPRGVPPTSEPAAPPATGSGPAKPRRFRPLGRRRSAPDAGAPESAAAPQGAEPPTTRSPARPDVPAPRSGSTAFPPPGPRPVPPRPAPPMPAGARQGPPSGPVHAYGAYPQGARPGPAPAPPVDGPGTWSAGTVAWWGLVSLLAGGSVGAAIGVLSLLLPA